MENRHSHPFPWPPPVLHYPTSNSNNNNNNNDDDSRNSNLNPPPRPTLLTASSARLRSTQLVPSKGCFTPPSLPVKLLFFPAPCMQYAVVQHPATILKRWETHWRRSKSRPGEGLDGPGTRPDPTRPDPRPLFEASTSTSTARIIHPSDPSRKRGTGNGERGTRNIRYYCYLGCGGMDVQG
ncbi:uncharacterized protein BO95DRAFT_86920 [Aspergillus brunneoviolaceus CBS 621.78]|uniref:Uncharacterized protein n=1 Tax=Aspergillus brunneoviolaceus CBS 621.78 TaxID=1450534 RepID=A0ACD1GDB9_9EURO|nr:hypothetical protein BO95DRAFT_86920 [Aspergillus brunneoviolaceus CBS 621.78]RAH47233.1 hypothetical protein BO95DRAFT_86920 [Aspergillus brunneoviolaceus CBS 621.78]